MEQIKIIALKESVLADNNADAQALREELQSRGTCLLNLMSSPGSGKTTTLLALNRAFDGRLRWGVMEADIDSAVDAQTIQNPRTGFGRCGTDRTGKYRQSGLPGGV